MKKLFSSIAAILIIAVNHGQYSHEVVNSQQVRKDLGPIAADNNGNTIITGYFANSITFGSITLTGSGGDIQFVAKKLINGTFAWAKMLIPLSIPSGTSYAHIDGVSTDAAGNVYLTGYFTGKIGFDTPNISLSSTKNGNTYTSDMFTIKMSSDGTVLWAKSAGTANNGCNAGEAGTSVTTDNAGNVYVTGQIVWKVFKNTTICNEIPGGSICASATSKSITCPYVVKYSSTGSKIWEKKFVNNGALAGTSCWYNHPQGTNIRTNGTEIYVNGYFYGTVDFGTGPLSTGNETTSNTFLIKLNSSGTTLWARSVTGNRNNPFGVGDDLFVDGNDIYISGLFSSSGTISFGACSLPFTSPATFLAKYSSNGTCQWSINPLGISYGVVRHPNGNLVMLRRGQFFYSIREFSPIDGSLIDSTVTPLEDTATGSAGGYPSFASLPDGFVFSQMVTGTYHFGNLSINASVPLSGGWGDLTLIKYTAPAPSIARPGNIMSESSLSKIILYPNPTTNQITIQNKDNKILGAIRIYDVNGSMIYKKFVGNSQTTIDVKNFSSGIYYIRSDQLQGAIKFVKQ